MVVNQREIVHAGGTCPSMAVLAACMPSWHEEDSPVMENLTYSDADERMTVTSGSGPHRLGPLQLLIKDMANIVQFV